VASRENLDEDPDEDKEFSMVKKACTMFIF
jgi:hypothetical protein